METLIGKTVYKHSSVINWTLYAWNNQLLPIISEISEKYSEIGLGELNKNEFMTLKNKGVQILAPAVKNLIVKSFSGSPAVATSVFDTTGYENKILSPLCTLFKKFEEVLTDTMRFQGDFTRDVDFEDLIFISGKPNIDIETIESRHSLIIDSPEKERVLILLGRMIEIHAELIQALQPFQGSSESKMTIISGWETKDESLLSESPDCKLEIIYHNLFESLK